MKTSTLIKQATLLTSVSFLSGSSLLTAGCAGHTESQKAPNIIIFFTDDLGYSDLGIHGADSDVRTPTWTSWPEMGCCSPMDVQLRPSVCLPARESSLVVIKMPLDWKTIIWVRFHIMSIPSLNACVMPAM